MSRSEESKGNGGGTKVQNRPCPFSTQIGITAQPSVSSGGLIQTTPQQTWLFCPCPIKTGDGRPCRLYLEDEDECAIVKLAMSVKRSEPPSDDTPRIPDIDLTLGGA